MNNSEINYRRKITNNVEQCSRTSSFPVQVMTPNYNNIQRTTYDNQILTNKINNISKMTPTYSNNQDCYFSLKSNSTSSSGFDVVSKTIEHTPVSSLFFSKINIDALQTGISNKLFNISNGKHNIGPQSEIELKIIMRSFYFDYLKNGFSNMKVHLSSSSPINNFDKDVVYTVKLLNTAVINWCVNDIQKNIDQYEHYKKTVIDSDGYVMPIDRSIYVSSAGIKSSGQLKI